ncbi:hypothetical protein ACFQY0_04830 [Haloferula chungangensis]|uniref:PEP-CTERM sorting domain-containing protein n=1 Tax=Haloferula chungangensis TaxID=1048331 RepID=A0ABW2L2C8_9BACT
MKSKKASLLGVIAGSALVTTSPSAIIISQYVETNSGTTPKGIELWNTGASTIDFSVDNLIVNKGVNGDPLEDDFTLTSGTMAPGEIIVIGTSDMGTYLDNTFGNGTQGSSPVQFFSKSFTFNGDDSLSIQVGINTEDIFGTPGTDPGSSWSEFGVSTANQNIGLNPGITTGSSGFTDPSIRFSTVSTDPSGENGLEGFGVAPIPEPSIALLGGLGLLALIRRRR